MHCPVCGQPTAVQPVDGVPRPVCGGCGEVIYPGLKVAVAVIVTRRRSDTREILLVKRGVEPFARLWSLPAGYLEPREDPIEAAHREVLEETGLNCTITRLLDAVPGEGLVDLLILYGARVRGSWEPRPGDDADDAAWFDLARLPPLAFRATVEMVARKWGVPVPPEHSTAPRGR